MAVVNAAVAMVVNAAVNAAVTMVVNAINADPSPHHLSNHVSKPTNKTFGQTPTLRLRFPPSPCSAAPDFPNASSRNAPRSSITR